ncbi:MAG: flagellar motor protein MotB [Zetaproteobacteria bacterium]|nr:MAG: flagellar motor protein MotB [Zetaproteobacteria bacterium]
MVDDHNDIPDLNSNAADVNDDMDGKTMEEAETSPTSSSDTQNNSEYTSIISRKSDAVQTVPLWLITFTDVMALMLTFFVLLYAMSVPEEGKWEEIANSFSSKFSYSDPKPHNAGSQDAINIDRIDTSRALSLSYLMALVENLLKANGIENVIVFENDKRLIISLPSDLLFKSGSAQINLEGKKVLFSLGGALTRVKNRIEIAGHTDPRPITGTNGIYRTNWELSLARSASVSSILKDVGYTRDITIRGLSSARFDEMSEDAPEEERYNLSRRVDIILMNDDGVRTKFYGLH